MRNMSNIFRHCQKIGQISLALILTLSSSLAQVDRAPASYIPDDDQIVVPSTYEKSFYQRVHESNEGYLRSHRTRIQNWITMDEFARNYGLEDAGLYNTSTPEQRRQYFERHYIRYFTKSAGRGAGRNLKEWWKEWNTDDEINAIESNINRKGYIIKGTSSSSTLRSLSEDRGLDVKVTINKKKHRWKFRFQPRIEQGSVKIKVMYADFYAMAFIGANGKQEVFVQKNISSLGIKTRFNYYIDADEMLAVIDRPFLTHFNLRFTHHKKGVLSSESLATDFEDNRVEVGFSMGF